MKNCLILNVVVFAFLFGSSVFCLSAQQEKRSIAYEVRKVIKEKGVDEAILHYKQLKKNSPEKYDFGVDQLHKLGQGLFNQGKREEALEILEFNAEMFPGMPKVYNILAQVYFYTGRSGIISESRDERTGLQNSLKELQIKKRLLEARDAGFKKRHKEARRRVDDQKRALEEIVTDLSGKNVQILTD